MAKYVIEVRDEAEGTHLGYYGGREVKSVSGPFVAYELKIVVSIEEAKSFPIEPGATINAGSLGGEFPGKTFKVREISPESQETSGG